MIDFDPNSPATEDDGLFGLPFSADEASVVIVPVPWDATSSQARASSLAPDAIFAASKYVELHDHVQGRIYEKGIAMAEACEEVTVLNEQSIAMQQTSTFHGEQLTAPCERLNGIVEVNVGKYVDAGKVVGVLGGDHSVAYGAIRAQLEQYPGVGILHIDAHCDLRRGFDGVRYSHASVMYNVVEDCSPDRLVQVGVRSYCDFEADYAREAHQIHTYFDADLHAALARGESWYSLCRRIVEPLPRRVYVSLDIDGLDPSMCPNTGTPVPGGLAYNDVLFLLRHVCESGRQVVGFDLVEAGASEFDANVAAHLLYQLCGIATN